MSRESPAPPNYCYRISFPRSLKTSKYNKTNIMLNFIMKTLEFKVFKEHARERFFDISNLIAPDSLATFRPFGYPEKGSLTYNFVPKG